MSSENRYTMHGSQIIDIETGELVNTSELTKLINQKINEEYTDRIADIIALNGDVEFKLVRNRSGNEYSAVNLKEGFVYTKLFRVDVKFMLENYKMSIIARGFLYTAMAYIHFPTNSIVIDGENPTVESLCETVGIGKTKLYEILKELEELDVLQRKKLNGRLCIYLNPFLHSCGLVDIETYKLFKDSPYNPLCNK